VLLGLGSRLKFLLPKQLTGKMANLHRFKLFLVLFGGFSGIFASCTGRTTLPVPEFIMLPRKPGLSFGVCLFSSWARSSQPSTFHYSVGQSPFVASRKGSFALVSLLVFLTLSATAAPRKSAKSPPLRVKGSFVIAAICRDGIIVASDSRGMLKNKEGRRIAYYDVNQKIFPIGNALIADTGYASLKDPAISFLSALMARFAENVQPGIDVEQLPGSYFNYVTGALPPDGAESARIQTLVFAGFRKTKPQLCIYRGESGRALTCRTSGYVSSPDQQIVALQNVSSLSFAQAARVMQETIDEYAAAVRPGLVGGPVVVRTITPSKSEWFDKTPDWPNWISFADLAKDFKTGRVPFHLMPGINKVELDTLVNDGATWSRLGQTGGSQ
jgi:hypothetical protein